MTAMKTKRLVVQQWQTVEESSSVTAMKTKRLVVQQWQTVEERSSVTAMKTKETSGTTMADS